MVDVFVNVFHGIICKFISWDCLDDFGVEKLTQLFEYL